MADHATLLPPNSTPVERAIEAALARVQDVPTPNGSLWDPNSCPSAFLPWLAWGVSVDTWNTAWDDDTKRSVIVASPGVHKRKGTASAVLDAVAAFGGDIAVTPWFEQAPPGEPFTFQVLLNVDANSNGADFAADVAAAVSAAKSERDQFTTTQSVSALGVIDVTGYGRPAAYLRLEMVQA